jgi:hypothetical protein
LLSQHIKKEHAMQEMLNLIARALAYMEDENSITKDEKLELMSDLAGKLEEYDGEI